MMKIGDWGKDTVMETEEASDGCGRRHLKERKIDWHYVIMFDNTFMRVGYFLTIPCKSQDREYMNILVHDSSGFGSVSYYNEPMIPFIKPLLD